MHFQRDSGGDSDLVEATHGVIVTYEDSVLTAETVEEIWPQLAPRLAPDAVILLKASRGVQLERLVPHLTTWATQ